MTKQEKKVLEKIIKDGEMVSTPGSSMEMVNGEWKFEHEPALVEGVANIDLLSDPRFKAGWARAWAEMRDRLEWLLLNPKTKVSVLVKYAGRA